MSSRSYRNNNPGNIRWSQFAENYGAVEAPGNMAKFPTVAQGLACMVALLASKNYRNLSIEAVIRRYAPSSDGNNPSDYADYVARHAGVPVGYRICELDPYQLLEVVEGMVNFEGWVT